LMVDGLGNTFCGCLGGAVLYGTFGDSLWKRG
jgi:hypothetical protein